MTSPFTDEQLAAIIAGRINLNVKCTRELATMLLEARRDAKVLAEENRILKKEHKWPPPYTKGITVFGMTLNEIIDMRSAMREGK